MASDLPVVAGEICPPGLSATATVAADHAAGVVALLDHLASAGVRQPVLFGPGAVSGWGMVLAETYRSWCRAHGVEPVTRETAFRATTAGVHAATVDLLADHPEVDGVVCASDIAALGVLRAAVEARRRVPADLLIAACVDAPALDATQASVTALSLRPRQLGVRCAQVLLGLVAGTAEPGPAPDLRPVDLLVRASTTR
jgi:DNA-binding LacI/PurR family transcriptional regulator